MKTKENNRKTGNRGEEIACFFLKKQGFLIVERNYLKKWGEIDIIALKDNIFHFIEVKSTIDKGMGYRPEENVTQLKVRKLRRMIETYFHEKKQKFDSAFKFHVITVSFNKITGKAKVKMIKDIIL